MSSDDGVHSTQDQSIVADASRSGTGLHAGDITSDQHINGSHAQVQQTTASADWEEEDITTSKPFPTGPATNDSGQQEIQHNGESNWWNISNWVKEKQQNRSRRKSELPGSLPFYTKFENEATQEKSSGPYYSHQYLQEGSEDGEAQTENYTQTALEKVQTFLGQGSSATYAAGANYAKREASTEEHLYDVDYVPAPEQYKPGLFGALLAYKLDNLQSDWTNNQRPSHSQHGAAIQRAKSLRSTQSGPTSGPTSGTATPNNKKVKWYQNPEDSNPTAAALMQAALSTASPGAAGTGAIPRPKAMRPKSADMISTAVDIIKHHHRHNASNSTLEKNVGLITDVADIIASREYLIKLCGAFMEYGAPTHRMEEYLGASARALLIDADFLHIPGAMICTFADRNIHANNVDIVRKRAGLDFSRLKDVFNVYKNVIHDKFTAQDGIYELENIRRRPDNYSQLFRIFMFGIASVIVGPFSFDSRPIDFGPIFVLGCAIGFMQVKLVPRSEHFSNVFEVFACVFAAFLARALGSIQYHDGHYIFCFSAIAQSTIAMILPGFMMLNSALELQSRNLISGSVRMVYVIVYVLFLAFGLLIGTTIFGLLKHDAVSVTTCEIPSWFAADENWKLIHTRFIWAPLFACCVGLIYQATWGQLPVMALIAVCGHQANFWISTQLSSNPQVANAIGAFVIGCISNLYSRLFHGIAATAMLPAIYCQVPGGLASSGSLVAGIVSANQIAGNGTNSGAQNESNDTIFNVGYGMVQVAIGISVGLYLSALAVYPYGKRKTALGSF